jgi:hypothetical protein
MRRKSRLDDEPRLQAEPRGGVPDVIDTLEGFHEACERFAAADGSVAADAERASGFRYGHEDWLVQFRRADAGIALFDPIALGHSSADWNEFNSAVGDATWILHDSLQDLPGFADLGMRPQRLFDTEIAARLLNMRHFGLAAVTEHYLGLTLAKEHSAAGLVVPSAAEGLAQLCGARCRAAHRAGNSDTQGSAAAGQGRMGRRGIRSCVSQRHDAAQAASGAVAAHLAYHRAES